LIDQRIKEHLGQAAAFQQVGAAYNQHLMGQRPRLPVLPTPVMSQIPGSSPLLLGIRPPVLPRPMAGPPGKLDSVYIIRTSFVVHALIHVFAHFACRLSFCVLTLYVPAIVSSSSNSFDVSD
jgi:hypothetical protein